MTARSAFAVAVALVVGLARHAEAAPLTLGLFAPSAPFPSSAARVELAGRLASALGKALHVSATARVYARAVDFAAAVKRGEVTLAVVDAAYLASVGGDPRVVAVALEDDEPTTAWQLVARRGTKLIELAGKRVLVPGLGGREADLVLEVLFGGDLGAGFARLEPAPDTASALAALGLGKADAVVVPARRGFPADAVVVRALPALPNPVLVIYGALTTAERADAIAAATAFTGDATFGGFRADDGGAVRDVARRFAAPGKRAPFAVPAVREAVEDLAPPRAFAIERTPAAVFALTGPAR